MPAFMTSKSFLLIALIVAALLAGLSGYALSNAGDDSGPTLSLPTAGPTPTLGRTASATPSVTPTASASATATAPATATPTATASPTPSATKSATPKPTPTKSATPKPSPTTKTYAYPKPTKTYAGLRLTGTFTGKTATVGDVYRVSAVATDGDGTIYMNGLSWGDGASVGSQPSPKKCKSYPPLHSPPGAYQPDPDKKDFGPYEHTFTKAGTYTIRFYVASVNADCRPNGPSNESTFVEMKVTVSLPVS
jgi:hypothetical protein